MLMLRGSLSASLLCGIAAICGCGSETTPQVSPWVTRESELIRSHRAPAYAGVPLSDLESALELALKIGEEELLPPSKTDEIPEDQRYRIPSGPEARTWQKVYSEYFAYRTPELEFYRRHTTDAGNARAAGEEFLEAYLRSATSQPGAPSLQTVRSLGEQAVERGSNDPLVRLYFARMLMDTPEKERAYDLLLAGVQNLQRVQALPITQIMARQWLVSVAKDLNRPKATVDALVHQAIDACVKFLESEAGKDDQRFAHWAVASFFYRLDREHREDALAACAESAGADKYHVHMMAGQYHYDLALAARGTGWISSVTEQQWQEFAKHLPHAAEHYRRAWQLHPECPEPPTALCQIARHGLVRDLSAREWFQNAVRAQFDYIPAYRAYATVTQPRWGGSHQQMLAFARECVETGRWDTRVPGQFHTILWNAQKEIGFDRPFGQYPGVPEIATQFAEGLLKAREQGGHVPADTPRHWAYAAGLCVQGEKYDLAYRIFEEVGDRLHQRDFDFVDEKMTYARGLAYAMTGPAGEHAEMLQDLLEAASGGDIQADHFEQLLDRLEQARALDRRPQTRPYFADVATIVQQLRGFYANEWVDLRFDSELSGWYVMGEETEILDERSFRVRSTNEHRGMQMRLLAKFPPPFVVEAEVANWPERESGYFLGLILGAPDSRSLYARREPRGVGLSTHCQSFLCLDGSGLDLSAARPSWRLEKEGPFHLLRIKVWPKTIQYFADYTRLTEEVDSPTIPFHPITFGELVPTDRPNSREIRNARIRRLDYGPPPPFTEREQWREFYTAERTLDPNDPLPYMCLGMERYHAQDYAAALALLKTSEERVAAFTSIRRLAYYLGTTLLALGRVDEAFPYYEKAVGIDPPHMDSFSNLAWICAAAPDPALRDPDRALKLARRACELSDYKHWRPLFALAAAHAERGEFEEARARMQEAMTLVPDDLREWLSEREDTIKSGSPLRIAPVSE